MSIAQCQIDRCMHQEKIRTCQAGEVLHISVLIQWVLNSFCLKMSPTLELVFCGLLLASDVVHSRPGGSRPSSTEERELDINVSAWNFKKSVNSSAPGRFEWNFRHVNFNLIIIIHGWVISCEDTLITWWRYQMKSFSVTRSFGVFLDLRLNKRLSKQQRCRWCETSL